jgi:hypothetical protein
MQTNNPEERVNTKELLEISFENEQGLLHLKEKDINNITIVEIQQEDGKKTQHEFIKGQDNEEEEDMVSVDLSELSA